MSLMLPTEQDLHEWVESDLEHLAPDVRSKYDDRKSAIRAVVGAGLTISQAASKFGLNRRTLTKTLKDTQALAEDGKPWGWRACLPRRVRNAKVIEVSEPPLKSGPGAFTQLIRAVPDAGKLLQTYTKPLPTRERRSSGFENFFEKFLTLLRKKIGIEGYPFNTGDRGRRALLSHLRKLRQQTPDIGREAELAEEAQAKQVQEVFAFSVLERLEFDAHRMDCALRMEVEDASGRVVVREISYVWLLVLICAVSRLILGYTIVVGRAYTQVDVLRVFARALRAWEARDLLVPNMQYVAESGIGTVPGTGRLLRGIMTAADNALAHHAKLTTANLTRHFRGVLNLGVPRVPETRGILEALFKKLADGAIRLIPGGFEPARDANTPERATTPYSPEKHPFNSVALHDLLDVIVAAYEVTPLPSLDSQSPMEIVRHHVNSGGWLFESSVSEDDSNKLVTLRTRVTIKGNQKEGRQPYVRYLYARYRAFGLRDRWDQVGQTYEAVMALDDMRHMTLLDKRGEVFARLTALPPWSRTRHDYDLRKLVHRWAKRGLFSIAGADDAIAAYRVFVRKNAAQIPAAMDQFAKHHHLHNSSCDEIEAPRATALVPRGGPVTFDHIKDPTK